MSESVAEQVRRTRREQGLPPKVQDPTTLQRIADLLLMTAQPQEKRRRKRAA